MDLEETKTIISLIVDSEGKLVGLLGDEDDEGCPIAFAPSADLVGALRVFLLDKLDQEADIVDERGLYQLALERLEMAWVKLNLVLEEE
ncbi:hypothetical protein A3K69_05595 [Candidatus Bathyarchaeota archaeon RBG_16_57_9]|nr:MAG: hypothetical protein A3K69_05595 [Candidatus Bathyarchaeota archaeon RBG_16_57_9]